MIPAIAARIAARNRRLAELAAAWDGVAFTVEIGVPGDLAFVHPWEGEWRVTAFDGDGEPYMHASRQTYAEAFAFAATELHAKLSTMLAVTL